MPKQTAGEANGDCFVDQRRVTQLEQDLEKLKAENRELRAQVKAGRSSFLLAINAALLMPEHRWPSS